MEDQLFWILFGSLIINFSVYLLQSQGLLPIILVSDYEQSISNKVRVYCVQAGIVQNVRAYCVQAGIVKHFHRLPIVVVLTEMQRGLSAKSIVGQRALTTLSLLYDIFFGNWAIGQLPIIFNRIPVETVNTYLILCINCMATYQISTFFPHIRMLSCSI